MTLSERQLQHIRRQRNERPLRRRRATRPNFPNSAMRNYQRHMTTLVEILAEVVDEIIIDRLPDLVAEARLSRGDRLDDYANDVELLISASKKQYERISPNLNNIADDIAEETSEFNQKQLEQSIAGVLGAAIVLQNQDFLPSTLRSFRNQNVVLMESLTDQSLNQIEGILQRGLQRGETVEQITEQINQRYDIARRRGDNISRNEIGNLNATLTELRNKAAGIEKFTWSTAQDERVRPSHAEKEGRVYRFDNPPADTGLPGFDFNCRCVAIPVVDDLLDNI